MLAASFPLFDAGAVVRRLRSDEAPYPGLLTATDPQMVWVDLALVPDDVWRCAPEGHLLVPVDLTRTPNGHAAVVPYCSERLIVAARAAESEGQVVTIAVSMLRACDEARRRSIEHGSWWVEAATGRPVLAAGGAAGWHDEAGEILDELRPLAHRVLSEALGVAVELIGRRRCTREELAAAEDGLFAIADPEPLTTSRMRRSAASEDARTTIAPRRAEALRADADAVVRAATWTARVWDSEWSARVTTSMRTMAGAIASLRARIVRERAEPNRREAREHTRPRSKRWIVAGAAAAVVIAVGCAWPQESPAADAARVAPGNTDAQTEASDAGATGDADAADETGEQGVGAPAEAEQPGEESGPSGLAGDDLDGAAEFVLRGLAACEATPASCAEVLEDPAGAAPHGAVGRREAVATLIDEYGGVAVYRVEAPDATAQIMVIVRSEEKWLVRDVYDVADQP